METSFQVSGMTCVACRYKVEHLLGQVPGVSAVEADHETGRVRIQSDGPPDWKAWQAVFADDPKYTLIPNGQASTAPPAEIPDSGFWSIYKPVLLLFLWIFGLSALGSVEDGLFSSALFMRYSMAGFFLAFSFFKFLDWKGFAESFAMYDLLASRWHVYGWIYPLLEVGLGLAWLTDFRPMETAWITLFLMAFSLMGVLRSVLGKKQIRCACLGSVFNLPLSSVAMVEDGMMVVMSAGMLVGL